jgi:peptidoglycan/LPS O-acetylase OafA/YrhL
VPRLMPAARRPELDGARGIAILLVFLGHLPGGVWPHNRVWLQGVSDHVLTFATLTGLQLFFVLSGFLITGSLLREHHNGGIRFGAFYVRRARRLYPALLAATAAFTLWTLATTSGIETSQRLEEIRPTLTYTWDIPALAPTTSYLSHAWSLAVEEQFYVVWPLLLLVALRVGGRRLAMAMAAVGCLTTIVLREVGGFDPVIIDHCLRWDALLGGCVLALYGRRFPARVGWIGWLALAVLTVRSPAGNLAYGAAALAAVIALAGSAKLEWLRHPVLVYFGRISYGLYLWHLLVMRLGLPGQVSLVLSIVAADLSWRIVERPWLTRRMTEPLAATQPA